MSVTSRLRSLIRAPHFHVSEPGRRRPVPRAHGLHGLALAAVRRSPQRPLVAGADGIHGIPELCCDSGIRWILQHAPQLAALDLPANLGAELEVVALVVNGPGAVSLHEDAFIRVGDELLEGERLLARQDADVGHANDGDAVPALGAHGAAGTVRADGVRRLAR